MNTLVVRSLKPIDILSLQGLRGYNTLLGMQRGGDREPWLLAGQLASFVPIIRSGVHVFVALLDGDLCAAVTARPQAHRYRWDVLSLAASSPLLDGPDDDREAVWTALLEYAIQQAGHAGAKRLFASACEHDHAYCGLRAAAFEPYTRFSIVSGTVPHGPLPTVAGFRRQEESDLWSIHQLYHSVTPVGVQYAEALTSAIWEPERSPRLGRIIPRASSSEAFVVETAGGIVAHCALDTVRGGAIARLLVDDSHREMACVLAITSARAAGLRDGSALRIIVPAYTGELVRQFDVAGYAVETERIALIRHTTAPALVRSRAVAPLADVPERAARRVPTYYHRMEETTKAAVTAAPCRRMERIAS